MDETKPMNQPDVIEVTLGSTEYTATPGKRAQRLTSSLPTILRWVIISQFLVGHPCHWIADPKPQTVPDRQARRKR
jgi:hypothetical protein